MNKFKLIIGCIQVLFLSYLSAQDYHVDANNGDDLLGNGSSEAPFQSYERVREVLQEGDTAIFYDGHYGSIVEQGYRFPHESFSDWVTLRSAEGANPTVDNIYFGGFHHSRDGLHGTVDIYLKVSGFKVLDGAIIRQSRHAEISNCLIERIGPWTGSVDNISKIAVDIRNVDHITIRNCEITNTGIGITARGYVVNMLDNHIHGGTHDGLRVTGMKDSLVEGNRIHDWDDGVDDTVSWSRHCDAIHIFIPGPAYSTSHNFNVTFRNNIIYDTESQLVQFNNHTHAETGEEIKNEAIVFENNVFGPARTVMFNNANATLGLVFRHNSVVIVPGGRAYHNYILNNSMLRIHGGSEEVYVYNNILGSIGIDPMADLKYFDYNIFQLVSNPAPVGIGTGRTYGHNTLLGVDALYEDPESFTGQLLDYSPAINFGTLEFDPLAQLSMDRLGQPRDARPDVGAVELPNETPPAEQPNQVIDDEKTIFKDNFNDGSYSDIDPKLNDVHQQGMSWSYPATSTEIPQVKFNEETYGFLRLFQLGESSVDSWLFSDQGEDWLEYEVDLNINSWYFKSGSGPLLMAIDKNNAYWLNLGNDGAKLIRILNGEEKLLAESTDLATSHDTIKEYRLHVKRLEDKITIDIDLNKDGIIELNYIETDLEALSVFYQGGIGFHAKHQEPHKCLSYDNISVQVLLKGPFSEIYDWTPPPTDYLDNFDDLDYQLVDVNLEAEQQVGLSWSQGSNTTTQFKNSYNSTYGGVINTDGQGMPVRSAWIQSNMGEKWMEYTFDFQASIRYLKRDSGPAFLVQDQDNAYLLDLGREADGKLYRMINREKILIATSSSLQLPHDTMRDYQIQIKRSADEIHIQIDADRDGQIDMTYVDTHPDALATFYGGGVGFFADYAAPWHSMTFNDVHVHVDLEANFEELYDWQPEGLIIPETPSVYIDDFEDLALDQIDVEHYSADQSGMSWTMGTNTTTQFKAEQDHLVTDGSGLALRSAWLLSEQGQDWLEYSVKFDVSSWYLKTGAGPTILSQDQNNAYWLNMGIQTVQLIRIIDGVKEVLVDAPSLKLDHNTTQTCLIHVARKAEYIHIEVDIDHDGVIDLNYIDDDSSAKNVFKSGGLGFHSHITAGWHNLRFDNCHVDVNFRGNFDDYYGAPINLYQDNFEDLNYFTEDLSLLGNGQKGLSWNHIPGTTEFINGRDVLGMGGAGTSPRTAAIFSNDGGNWSAYNLSFTAYTWYLKNGYGPALLVQNDQTYYWIDMGINAGHLYRCVDGVMTELSQSNDLRALHGQYLDYKVSVASGADGIEIQVDKNSDGIIDFIYFDTDSIAIDTFKSGGFGFNMNAPNAYHSITVDNVSTEVTQRIEE